jgi:hypothetical protein
MTKNTARNLASIVLAFVTLTSFAQWTRTGTVTSLTTPSDQVGIGTSSPSSQVEIVSGNRKMNLNPVLSGVSAGSIISLSRTPDGTPAALVGVSATPGDEAVIFSRGGSSEMRFVSGGLASDGFGFYMNMTPEAAFAGTRPGSPVFKINGAGNVGIGTAIPDAKLAVKGKIHAQEVQLDLSVPGPDYVFEKEYNLLPLSELNLFIRQNKHLPEVPSAAEMKENGIYLKEMNMLLLKKVEELTLYTIDLNQENQDQTEKIEHLQQQVDNLEKTMAQLLEKLK